MATKELVARMTYQNSKGEDIGSRASIDAVSLRYDFVNKTGTDEAGKSVYETYDSRTVTFADFAKEIMGAAAAHGIKQKLSDTYAGVKSRGESPIEAWDTGLEQLMAGIWVQESKGGSGTTPTILMTAALRVMEGLGKDVSNPELIAKLRDWVSKEETKKQLMSDPDISAAYDAIKLERAKEKAKASAAKAKASEEEGVLASF